MAIQPCKKHWWHYHDFITIIKNKTESEFLSIVTQPFHSVFRDYILYPSISAFYPTEKQQSSGLNSLLKYLELAEAASHTSKKLLLNYLHLFSCLCTLNAEKLSLYCWTALDRKHLCQYCTGQKESGPEHTLSV